MCYHVTNYLNYTKGLQSEERFRVLLSALGQTSTEDNNQRMNKQCYCWLFYAIFDNISYCDAIFNTKHGL